jgi:hypothetical protein
MNAGVLSSRGLSYSFDGGSLDNMTPPVSLKYQALVLSTTRTGSVTIWF